MKSKLNKIKKLHALFKKYPLVKLVYFFGSRYAGDSGPLSDYDFAIYIDSTSIPIMQNIKIQMLSDLYQSLKTDSVDLVVLNSLCGSDLKFNIISEGMLIYEREPYKIIIEPNIMNEYYDYHAMMLRHGLTKG